MAASNDAEGARALEDDLAGEAGPTKKPKSRRQWSGKMPATLTPIRPGTKTKTPIRQSKDEIERAEKVQDLDEQMTQLNDQIKNLRISMNQLQVKLHDAGDDQHAYRVEQLWALKAQIAEQRDKASREQCIVGWPPDLTQAGPQRDTCQMSHGIKPSQVSPKTLLIFQQPWMRVQLDKWYKEENISKKRGRYFYTQGKTTNDQIKMRPQIALWDRIKGEPLKISLKAMDLAVQEGMLKLDMNKIKPWWSHNAIYDDCGMYVWVHFSVRDVLATVLIDESVYQAVADKWAEAHSV